MKVLKNRFFLINFLFFLIIGVWGIKFLLFMVKIEIPATILNVAFLTAFSTLFIVFNRNAVVEKNTIRIIVANILYFLFSSLLFIIVSSSKNHPNLYTFVTVINKAYLQVLILIFVLIYSMNKLSLVKFEDNIIRLFGVVAIVLFSIGFIENALYYLNISTFERFQEDYTANIIMRFQNYRLLRTFGLYFSGLDYSMIFLMLFVFFASLNNKIKEKKIRLFLLLSFVGIFMGMTKIIFLLFFLFVIFNVMNVKSTALMMFYHFMLLVVFPFAVFFFVFFIKNNFIEYLDYSLISSSMTRYISWLRIYNYCVDNFTGFNFLFGYGISQTEVANPYKDVFFAIDNTYISIFLYSGVIGLSFISFLFFYYLILFNRIKKTENEELSRMGTFLLSSWNLFPYFAFFNNIQSNFFFLTVFLLGNIIVSEFYKNELKIRKNACQLVCRRGS